jgi:uncharacterized membrane protein
MKALNQPRNMQILSAVLAAAGVAISLYLFYSKISKSSIICTPGSECDAVNASPYSMLLGIPVSAIGALGYLAILALALWAIFGQDHTPTWLSNARFIFASGGLFFAAYLTGIEAFVLHAYCIWCVMQAIAILGIFVGLLYERRLE